MQHYIIHITLLIYDDINIMQHVGIVIVFGQVSPALYRGH